MGGPHCTAAACFDVRARVVQRREIMLVETLVAPHPIEALDEAVLDGPAKTNKPGESDRRVLCID